MVERFMHTRAGMVVAHEGPWVRHLDYAALEAQLARLQQVVVKYGDRARMSFAPPELQQEIDDTFAALEATPPAPKVTEAMVETEMVRMTVSETIRAMGENPDEQIIGELTVFDAVAVKVRAALTAAMEAGKP